MKSIVLINSRIPPPNYISPRQIDKIGWIVPDHSLFSMWKSQGVIDTQDIEEYKKEVIAKVLYSAIGHSLIVTHLNREEYEQNRSRHLDEIRIHLERFRLPKREALFRNILAYLLALETDLNKCEKIDIDLDSVYPAL